MAKKLLGQLYPEWWKRDREKLQDILNCINGMPTHTKIEKNHQRVYVLSGTHSEDRYLITFLIMTN